jgi:polysaccharide pyruvyl transferase WcaK-like protein
MDGSRRSFVRLRTQCDNVGDALITRELIRLLAKHSEVWADASGCPDAFVDEVTRVPGTMHIVNRFGALRLYARLAVASLGGARCFYFLLPGGLTGEKSRAAALRAHLQASLLGLLRYAGVMVCHVGASCTNLGPRYRRVVASRSQVLDAHYVRDAGTRAYLTTFGARVDGIVPDLALGLYRNRAPQSGSRPYLALSFRLDGPRHRQIDRITRTAHAALEASRHRGGCKVISQVRRDDGPMAALAETLRREHPAADVQFVRVDSIAGCVDAYADVHTLLSNRLHALIVAGYAGATPVAVIDERLDAKVSGLFTELGLGDHVVTDTIVDFDLIGRLHAPDPDLMATQVDAIDRIFHRIFSRDRLSMYAHADAIEAGHSGPAGGEP